MVDTAHPHDDKQEETITIVSDSHSHSLQIGNDELVQLVREAVHTEYVEHNTRTITPQQRIAQIRTKVVHSTVKTKAEYLCIAILLLGVALTLVTLFGDMLTELGFHFLEEVQIGLIAFLAERVIRLFLSLVGKGE